IRTCMDEPCTVLLINKIYRNAIGICLLLNMASSSTASASSLDTSTAVLIRVDLSGHGHFTKIQDAVDFVPCDNTELVFIWIKPGTYSFGGPAVGYECRKEMGRMLFLDGLRRLQVSLQLKWAAVGRLFLHEVDGGLGLWCVVGCFQIPQQAHVQP
ncbi:hypothetical protein Drorol1_Dr00016664, partial [Drosera rotundifolia]